MHLDELRDGPFRASDDAPMHHDGPMLPAVRTDVLQPEPLGLVEIDLHGGQGGLPPRRIHDLHIDLGPIESGLALDGLVSHPRRIEHVPQQRGGPPPKPLVIDVLTALVARPRQRQPVPSSGDPEIGVRPPNHLQGGTGLIDGLLTGTEDMPVIELNPPNPGEPTEHARQLRPIHRAQLGDPQRQFAITPRSRPIDERMMRTEGRPQHDLLRPHLHRRKHVVAVVLPVPRDLVQLPLPEHGRVHMPIPGRPLHVPQVLLQRMPYDGPVRQPVRQPGPHQRIGTEQLQLPPKAPVVVRGFHRMHGSPSFSRSGREPAAQTEAPGSLTPGLRHQLSSQRAGTLSGVVVRDGRARFMRRR